MLPLPLPALDPLPGPRPIWLLVTLALCATLLGLRLLRGSALRRRSGSARRLEVVEVLGLAPRRSLMIVRVDGQEMLLGNSEQGLQTLAPLGGVRGTFLASASEVRS